MLMCLLCAICAQHLGGCMLLLVQQEPRPEISAPCNGHAAFLGRLSFSTLVADSVYVMVSH